MFLFKLRFLKIKVERRIEEGERRKEGEKEKERGRERRKEKKRREREGRKMSETRPNIRIVKDVGYKVIMRREDGSPRQVFRCFIKEGDYGKFVAIEQHWVQRMDGEKILESEWARRSYNFSYDRERAVDKWNSIRELLEDALNADLEGEQGQEEVEEVLGVGQSE